MPLIQLPREYHPQLGRSVKPTDTVVDTLNPVWGFTADWTTGFGKAASDRSGLATNVAVEERSNLRVFSTASPGGLPLEHFETYVDGAEYLTVVVKIKWNALGVRDGVFGATRFGLNLGFSTDSSLFMYVDAGNFVPEFVPIGGALVAGRFYTFVFIYDGTLVNADRLKLWTNGQREIFTPPVLTPTSIPAQPSWEVGSGDGDSDAEIEVFRQYDYAFSEAQAEQVSADPYRYLESALPMSYHYEAAAGGFQAAWARRQSQFIGAGVR